MKTTKLLSWNNSRHFDMSCLIMVWSMQKLSTLFEITIIVCERLWLTMSIEGVLTSINNLFKYLIEVICILVTRLFFQNNLFNNPHLGPIHARYCKKKKTISPINFRSNYTETVSVWFTEQWTELLAQGYLVFVKTCCL